MALIAAHAHKEGPQSGPGSARSLLSCFSAGSRRQPKTSSDLAASAYFRLEDGLSSVRFHPVEFFDDSFPIVQCWQDLREWLLVFLVDDRNGLSEEVLPELQRRRHELTFITKSLRSKFKVNIQVPLQALLLRHRSPHAARPDTVPGGDGAGRGLTQLFHNFLTGLQDITIACKQDTLQQVIDFDDGEQLCACIAKKIRHVLEWERVSMEELV